VRFSDPPPRTRYTRNDAPVCDMEQQTAPRNVGPVVSSAGARVTIQGIDYMTAHELSAQSTRRGNRSRSAYVQSDHPALRVAQPGGISSPPMAPVMIATASDMLKLCGSITATRRPRRWMCTRSATSNTLGMLWLIRMTGSPRSRT